MDGGFAYGFCEGGECGGGVAEAVWFLFVSSVEEEETGRKSRHTEEEEDRGCGFRGVGIDERDGVWAAWTVGWVEGEDGSEVSFGGDAGWHFVSCFP